LKKKTGPPTVPLATSDEFTKFKDNNDVAVVGFFPDAESEAFKTYVSVADGFDDVVFGVITDPQVAGQAGLEAGKVAVFKQGNMSKLHPSNDKLLFFIRGELVPLIQEMTAQVMLVWGSLVDI